MTADTKVNEAVLSVCETVAAITTHARMLTKKGRFLHGGADSKTLCGQKPAWDLRGEVSTKTVRCRTCRNKLQDYLPIAAEELGERYRALEE